MYICSYAYGQTLSENNMRRLVEVLPNERADAQYRITSVKIEGLYSQRCEDVGLTGGGVP
jgi:hypothetical protein